VYLRRRHYVCKKSHIWQIRIIFKSTLTHIRIYTHTTHTHTQYTVAIFSSYFPGHCNMCFFILPGKLSVCYSTSWINLSGKYYYYEVWDWKRRRFILISQPNNQWITIDNKKKTEKGPTEIAKAMTLPNGLHREVQGSWALSMLIVDLWICDGYILELLMLPYGVVSSKWSFEIYKVYFIVQPSF